MFPTLLVLLSVATLGCALHLPVDPEFLLKKGPINNRVMGGVDTPIEAIPWQVLLLKQGSHYCGGVIYGKNIIITAAHCVCDDNAKILDPKIFDVQVGSSTSDNGGSVIKVAKTIVHDRFTLDPIIEYDIALILLSSPLEMGPTVKAIPLAESVPDDGASAIVSGWGWTETEANPLHLQSGNVTILSREKCARVFGDKRITKVTVCASSPGSCHGDSGGPLVSNDKLVGIVSFGKMGCPSNSPGVYANVVELRKWIEEEAKNLSSI
ncbi:trypsin delta-like [Drosophila sulfurigaster albostrigata]|uniref:trypsin delta-like n=1 Tax=Drosophila sulfurigaster albostrigata TaxID=89887 RepID=UPI002D218D62|nr:trypsin delta-like [Drosophila sulfurigaster albostrigata]